MALTYSPVTPPEWIALYVILMLSMIPVITMSYSAFSHQWKLWYRSKRFGRPWFMLGPIIHMSCFAAAQILAGTGIFLIWREGQRSEALFAPPGPAAAPPSHGVYFVALLLYLIEIFYLSCIGPVFFGFQAFGMTVACSVLAAALSIVILVLGYIVWWVAGLILSFPVVFLIYGCCVSISIFRFAKIDRSGTYVEEYVQVMWAQHVKSLSESEQNWGGYFPEVVPVSRKKQKRKSVKQIESAVYYAPPMKQQPIVYAQNEVIEPQEYEYNVLEIVGN